jgi:hypothetical protein
MINLTLKEARILSLRCMAEKEEAWKKYLVEEEATP